jgi:hypothetical protein
MYVEGDVPYVGTTNGNANSGFFGGDGGGLLSYLQ